jgi:hypothetical protein
MPELTASTREAARRIGLTDTAMHKTERGGRIAREPDGQWDIDKTRRRLTETADPARFDAATLTKPRSGAAPPGPGRLATDIEVRLTLKGCSLRRTPPHRSQPRRPQT